jgi:glycosyltransferase involved in cell wall biosynthesis
MLVRSDVATDSRVLREAVTLRDAGHRVHVIGKDVPVGWTPPTGVTVTSTAPRSVLRRRPTAPRPALSPPLRLARWALLPRHNRSVTRDFAAQAVALAEGLSFDVVHAHDFSALPLGAELARRRRARLVYDAHEWWSGRLRSGRPTPLERRVDARRERRLGAEADAVLTVSPGIAERFARWGWRHVTVVRNTFPRAGAPGTGRTPLARPAGLVYAGRLGAGRDLPAVLAAAPGLAPLRVTLVGPVDVGFVAGLALGPARLLPSTSLDAVDELLATEGLAVIPLEDSCENHRLALPNKLFHAVHAGVPVVAADLPELRRVVRGRNGGSAPLGTLYRPGDAAALTAAAREAVARYPQLVAAVHAAGAELSWERDAGALLEVYERLR